MTKKSFVIILILSVIVAYIIAIIDAIARGTLIGGSAGLPFKFASGYLRESNTNYFMLLADIVFWFLIILIILNVLKKRKKK